MLPNLLCKRNHFLYPWIYVTQQPGTPHMESTCNRYHRVIPSGLFSEVRQNLVVKNTQVHTQKVRTLEHFRQRHSGNKEKERADIVAAGESLQELWIEWYFWFVSFPDAMHFDISYTPEAHQYLRLLLAWLFQRPFRFVFLLKLQHPNKHSPCLKMSR